MLIHMAHLCMMALLTVPSTAFPVTGSPEFSVRVDGPASPFPHTWEESVGSGHMVLALRSDYREQLRRCHDELGFKRVRMHGMMDDEMSTSLGPGWNSYINLDSVIDFVLSIGMDVLFEIGFMPEWIASNDTHIMHYNANTSPPKDYDLWAKVMEDLASHLFLRYGSEQVSKWFFEVWNEPTINFWSGEPKMETYFKFYEITVRAFHRVSKHFRLGGPVSNELRWIPEFVAYCEKTNTPISFVSSHTYAGGGLGPIFDADQQAKRVAEARDQVPAHLPFIVSEWGGTYSHDEPLDAPSYAPFIISAVAQNVNKADMFSFWAFSDVFEEAGMPSGAYPDNPNFGLVNVYGVPKPSYRAFQLLHWAGDERLVVSQNKTLGACNESVSVLALRNKTHFSVFVTNTGPLPLSGSNLTDNVTDCTVMLNLPAEKAVTTRIDTTHANPKAHWLSMGSPPYPSKDQIRALEEASELEMESIAIHDNSLVVVVPSRGLYALFAEIGTYGIFV
eukprot:TRINITY_DN1706_c0_g1_i1.p1 TRINITY_DN1706_c0_g1~~TRINITY_DN1706_c0_g1_i1.p1  ORF type:complete len:504 (+),score=39.34 TRINITY_DN1706_c0_g1_i1:67-1578(+)